MIATASGGAIGAVVPNVSATNFFDSRNVITAGGATRDPLFSVIESDGASGISITTLTDDLSTVLAVDGVNDVFAEVVFDIPTGAEGEFLLTLGPGSTISDENGIAIPFTFIPGTVRVFDPGEVPAVSTWGMIVMSLLLVVAGWPVLVRRSHGTCVESGGSSPGGDGHPALVKFAKMLERHEYGIISHCKHQIHTSKLEGVNNKIKVIKRIAYGFHDLEYFALKVKQALPGRFSSN